MKNKLLYSLVLLAAAGILKFGIMGFLNPVNDRWMVIAEIILIMVIGAGFVLKGTADIIEETTEVLSEKTKIASGVLQSLGTAFPDMALGVVAAIVSLRLASTDYGGAINFAIIAAATTFGSNIYNVAYAIWCIYRQNLANDLNKAVLMIPPWKNMGKVIPMDRQAVKPTLKEFDVASNILSALTVLTAVTAIGMVIFGRVTSKPANMDGDLYQLIRPVGLMLFLLTINLIYRFRKSHRPANPDKGIQTEEKYFKRQSIWVVWLSLLLSGGAILMAAESMVKAIEVFSLITHIPLVISGAAAGIIGCLGEIIVIHNYSINPKGRLGDAVVGVAMDNVVTTMGAAIVAMMGGIFLGGNALILIFVLILALNTVLVGQISKLKNYYLKDDK